MYIDEKLNTYGLYFRKVGPCLKILYTDQATKFRFDEIQVYMQITKSGAL